MASRPRPKRALVQKWIGVAAAQSAYREATTGQQSGFWIAVLPLELCPGVNAYSEMPPWARARLRKRAFAMLLAQHGMVRRKAPLAGRPSVVLTRFSSVEPDAHSAWSKVPVDCLVMPWVRGGKRHDGLGFLEDDRPSCVAIETRWVKSPPGRGFVAVEVLGGELSTETACALGVVVSSGERARSVSE